MNLIIQMNPKQNRKVTSLETKFSNVQVKYVTLQKDEILYKHNDPSDSLFLVIDGLIELKTEKDKNDSLKTRIKKDEFFGLEDILQNIKRPQTATALEISEVLKIKLTNISKNQTASLFNDLPKTRVTDDLLLSLTKTSAGKKLFDVQDITDKKVVSFFGPRGDLTNAVLFRDFLFRYIDDGNTDLIINLLALKTIDSTFLGTLVACLKKTSSSGGGMKLVCDQNILSWLFVVTKMDKVFKIYDTLEEAINS